MKKFTSFVITLFALYSCKDNQEVVPKVFAEANYRTENVIIVVVDGPRYTETWGDSTHKYQPFLADSLAEEGIIYTNFYNHGVTFTNPGHTAITTGNYQSIDNSGKEFPNFPSIFQQWLKKSNADTSLAWIIASKDKLQILADCEDSLWKGVYLPSSNCGINGSGIGSGYREDSVTFIEIEKILQSDHPKLTLINFKEPDVSGHANNWNKYLEGIRKSDYYVHKLWTLIKNDPIYSNKTTMFVTNDHGRHLDGHLDGYISHGDNCNGCRHINLFAIGPDFKQGQLIEVAREQIDISATISELMGFQFATGKGSVMREMFSNGE